MSPTTTNSDSEDDDLDYVPSADDEEQESSDHPNELGTSTPAAPPADPDPAEQKRRRDALWASFTASVVAPSDGSTNGNGAASEAKLVKVERTYLFAGKHVTEVVEVPEDSVEATRWPRWSPRPLSSDAVAPSSEDKVKEVEEVAGDSPTRPPAATSPAPPTTATSTPGAKRPGPRKSRVVLPSLTKASQAKKITTLDKSAMDWRTHVASQSSDVKDELDVNRRGGGYLEKVEFLKRVGDRRDDAFEASKASKRRKT